MQFYKDLRKALEAWQKSFQYIERQKILHLIFIPAIISIFVGIFMVYLAFMTTEQFRGVIFTDFGFSEEYDWLQKPLTVLLRILFMGILLFFLMKIYRYVLLIILSPFFLALADRMYMEREQRKVSRSFLAYFVMAVGSSLLIIKCFIIELSILVVFGVIILLFSWMGPLAPFILLIVESYFTGYIMADFHLRPRSESVKLLNHYRLRHPGKLIGIGLVFNISLLVPLFGVLFAPVLGIVASGISYVEPEKENLYVFSFTKSI
jgi:CysZ protein